MFWDEGRRGKGQGLITLESSTPDWQDQLPDRSLALVPHPTCRPRDRIPAPSFRGRQVAAGTAFPVSKCACWLQLHETNVPTSVGPLLRQSRGSVKIKRDEKKPIKSFPSPQTMRGVPSFGISSVLL